MIIRKTIFSNLRFKDLFWYLTSIFFRVDNQIIMLYFYIIHSSINFIKLYTTTFWQLYNYCSNLMRPTYNRYLYEILVVFTFNFNGHILL